MTKEIVLVYGIIYKCTNLINGKIYIGQTKDLGRRRISHENLKNKKLSVLSSAIKKYGKENFEWKTIDSASSKNELNYKEIFYIILFNTNIRFGKGYNVAKGGEGGSTTEHMKTYNNGVCDIKLLDLKIVPDGFVQGSLNKPNTGKHWRWYNNGVLEFWINELYDNIETLNKGRLKNYIIITDGLVSKRISKNSIIPKGWEKGSCQDSSKGRIWVNNKEISKMVYVDEFINMDSSIWCRGMCKANSNRELQKKRDADPNTKRPGNYGKKHIWMWITDGIISKQARCAEEIEEGFWKGRSYGNKK